MDNYFYIFFFFTYFIYLNFIYIKHGLVLERTISDEGNRYIDLQQEVCPIESSNLFDTRPNADIVVFKFDFKTNV